MDRAELKKVLRELMEEETGDASPQLEESADLRDGLNLDSVDLVCLLLRIEHRFKIKISSEEFGGVTTVGQLLDLLQPRIAQAAARQAA
jgi:acyl carrier protein